MPSPTAASAMPMRRTWLTNVASPNGSAMRSSSTTWPGEQSMERSTRARRAYKAMQTWPCRRVKGDWRRRLGHGGPHACRSGVLGGPRTVRTDLFAAIALPVLTLFVLLYTASLLAVMHPSCGRLGCAVAVGIGNTLGSGETGRKCMFISPGVATRGLTGVQCGIRNDHNVVCARKRCSVTTISRGRNRLWPSGLQYNARRMQIARTSSSLCTGILAGRCSAICMRQHLQIRKERSQLIGALIMWFAGRDQHMQLHHR